MNNKLTDKSRLSTDVMMVFTRIAYGVGIGGFSVDGSSKFMCLMLIVIGAVCG